MAGDLFSVAIEIGLVFALGAVVLAGPALVAALLMRDVRITRRMRREWRELWREDISNARLLRPAATADDAYCLLRASEPGAAAPERLLRSR